MSSSGRQADFGLDNDFRSANLTTCNLFLALSRAFEAVFIFTSLDVPSSRSPIKLTFTCLSWTEKSSQFFCDRYGLLFRKKVAAKSDRAAVHFIGKSPEWSSHVQDGTLVGA